MYKPEVRFLQKTLQSTSETIFQNVLPDSLSTDKGNWPDESQGKGDSPLES